MKYYIVIFSDYSETIGTAKSAAEMMKSARHYCKLWNLAETPREVIEITETEYNARKR